MLYEDLNVCCYYQCCCCCCCWLFFLLWLSLPPSPLSIMLFAPPLQMLTLTLPTLLLFSPASTNFSCIEPGPALRLRHYQQSARLRCLCEHHIRGVEPTRQPLRLPPSLSANACLDSMASSELRMERTCTRPPCLGCAWPQQPPSPETWGPPSCPALNAIYFPLSSTAGVS